MSWVIQFDTTMLKDGYSPAAAMVYGYLWWNTWEAKVIWDIKPSLWLMVKTLNIGRASVSRWIHELEKWWLVEVFREKNKKNIYFVCDLDKYPAVTWYSFQRMVKWCNEKDRGSPFWTSK